MNRVQQILYPKIRDCGHFRAERKTHYIEYYCCLINVKNNIIFVHFCSCLPNSMHPQVVEGTHFIHFYCFWRLCGQVRCSGLQLFVKFLWWSFTCCFVYTEHCDHSLNIYITQVHSDVYAQKPTVAYMTDTQGHSNSLTSVLSNSQWGNRMTTDTLIIHYFPVRSYSSHLDSLTFCSFII